MCKEKTKFYIRCLGLLGLTLYFKKQSFYDENIIHLSIFIYRNNLPQSNYILWPYYLY